MDNIYENIEEYNPNKKRKMLIIFYDMIADMLSNKKSNAIVTQFFLSEVETKYFSCSYNTILFCYGKKILY